MSYLGSWKLNDYLVFVCNTHDPTTGAATDDDGSPTYRIYEDETTVPIATGTMAKLDDVNTTGFYSERIQITSPTYTKGKHYTVYIQATVGGVMGTISHQFQIEAEVSIPTVNIGSIVDAVWDELKSDHTTPDTFGDYLDIEVSSRLAPTTASRTLDVTANGNAGIDWGNVESTASINNLNNTFVNANVLSFYDTPTYVVTAQMAENIIAFFNNNGADTTKVVDDVGTGAASASAIADAVWDEARLDHLAVGSYGEQMDWMLHKDTNRTFDRSTDSLEAIRDSMATGGAIPSVGSIADAVWDEAQVDHIAVGSFGKQIYDIKAQTDKMTFDVNNYIYAVPQDIAQVVIDNIVNAVWDELRSEHVIDGSFGQGVITYSLATQAKADVNAEVDTALVDIRLDEIILNANEGVPTANSFWDLITSKDATQTFNRSTDSLEAIRDSQFALTTIIDGTIDVQSILKRIHALVSGNGSTREGDVYTFKAANGSNYIRQTISESEVVTALV